MRAARYMSRPPIALQRLSLDGDGLVVYVLKHPFRDGTTHVLFEPLDFMARLAALVPRPRAHLVRYHGVFAPNAKQRHLIITRHSSVTAPGSGAEQVQPDDATPCAPMNWMQRLRRVFDIDLRFCPHCGAELRVLAVITNPRVIATILEHRTRHASRDPPVTSQPVVQPPP